MNEKKYYLIDASLKPLGRTATRVANLLRNKNSASYKPNVIPQNIVIVVNAGKVFLTGTKELSKRYYHYSGYHGGLKTKTFSELKEKNPCDIVRKAVLGMLPKNRLQDQIIKNLKVFADENHSFSKFEIIKD